MNEVKSKLTYLLRCEAILKERIAKSNQEPIVD